MGKISKLFRLSLVILIEWQLLTMASKNSVTFERLVWKKNPESDLLSYIQFEMKKLSHTNLRVMGEVNLTRPVRGVNGHLVVYYKYNTYQKWAIDLWEDLCGWLDGTKRSWILDLSLKKLLDYTNLGGRKCPLEGNFYVRINNFSLNSIAVEQLVPSGRYRLDLNLTEENKKNVVVMASAYLSVSDHRIEQF